MTRFMAAGASLDLAGLLQNQPGRDAEAEAAFRRAVDATRADPDVVPEAVHHFAVFLLVRSRWEAAEAALREAMALEHPCASRDLAAGQLAYLLADQPGREHEAEAVLRESLTWEDLADRRAVLIDLGLLLAGQPGRLAEAEDALKEAMDDTYYGCKAALVLGRLLAEQPGRESEAEAALRAAMRDSDWRERAAADLARLLDRQAAPRDDAEESSSQAAGDDPGASRG